MLDRFHEVRLLFILLIMCTEFPGGLVVFKPLRLWGLCFKAYVYSTLPYRVRYRDTVGIRVTGQSRGLLAS